MVQALLLGAGDVTIVMAGKTTLAHPNTMIGHVHAVRLAAIDLAVTMFTVDAGVLARQAVVGLFASGMMLSPAASAEAAETPPRATARPMAALRSLRVFMAYTFGFSMSHRP